MPESAENNEAELESPNETTLSMNLTSDSSTAPSWSQQSPHNSWNEMASGIPPAPSTEYNTHLAPPEMRDIFPGPFSADQYSGLRTPRGLITFGLQTDLDLSMLDLSFLETYNSQIPFECDEVMPLLPVTSPTQQCHEAAIVENDCHGARSAQRLRWRFVPAPQDHGYIEHDNLLLPNNVNAPVTPHSVADGDQTESLDLASRDRILSIVLGQMKHSISAVLTSFPSVQLLDSLIQYYLTAPFSSAGPWIHRASLDPPRTCPELLLAMAAAGAVLTPDPSLRKLGFAMQEVVRLRLPTVFEDDNTTVRVLELHQAYLLYLEIGLWSGNSRKIEISEAFRQPLITMIRRGGLFHHSTYSGLPAIQWETTGATLDQKWRTWVREESAKRLVYHLLRLEAEVSMILLTAPLVTYAEVSLPLPAPRALWEANSAQKWKELICSQYPNNANEGFPRIPTLTESVANLDVLDCSHSIADIRLSAAAVLHCIWGLVWEYRQFNSLLGSDSRYWDNEILMTSRRQQLIRMLQFFAIGYKDRSAVSLNLIHMHMYISLEEIENLATADDPHRAYGSQRALRDWHRSPDSRHAVWHAGQVVKALRAVNPQGLRDFNAIAAYHATLVLWAYSMESFYVEFGSDEETISDNLDPGICEPLNKSFQVWLDGVETDGVRQFLALSRGIPMLQNVCPEDEPVLLRHPRTVLLLMIQLMQQNHHQDSAIHVPPLVANLVHLLGKLRDASK